MEVGIIAAWRNGSARGFGPLGLSSILSVASFRRRHMCLVVATKPANRQGNCIASLCDYL